MKDIRSETYNALAKIMFETGATREDMEKAIEWFELHFYEDEMEESETPGPCKIIITSGSGMEIYAECLGYQEAVEICEEQHWMVHLDKDFWKMSIEEM